VAGAARALGFPPPNELKEKPPVLTLVPDPPAEPEVAVPTNAEVSE
jgi:hypothetical protein